MLLGRQTLAKEDSLCAASSSCRFAGPGATDARFTTTITVKKALSTQLARLLIESLPAAYPKLANNSGKPGRKRSGELGSKTATEKMMREILKQRVPRSNCRPGIVFARIHPRAPIPAANSGGFQATVTSSCVH